MLDRPQSKRTNGPRMPQGKPGSAAFYRNNVPDRFNNTKIAVRNTMNAIREQEAADRGDDTYVGVTDDEAEIVAVRVLRWNEGQGPARNQALIDKDKAMQKAHAAKEE